MPTDSTKKILTVAAGVCLVCSILVSTSTVTLRDIQKKNQTRERLKNILAAGNIHAEKEDVEDVYRERIRPAVVELNSGRILSKEEAVGVLHPDRFDVKTLAADPEYGRAIPPPEDIAHIQRMPTHMTVYMAMDGDETTIYILPIYGKGLWSTMYGFIALDRDKRTIRGFTFYEHGETPGLGGEIDNPGWKKLWAGKEAFDAEGNLRIEVIKGAVDPSSPEAGHQIDGLSGSTLTTRGVNHTVRFWLGENGYGRFIRNMSGG